MRSRDFSYNGYKDIAICLSTSLALDPKHSHDWWHATNLPS